MLIGVTYSHREIKWLKLNLTKSFNQTLDMRFDIIRLSVYWDESQPTASTFEFSTIEKLLDMCDQRQQKVLLSIGMKAPRWPEYYVPKWLKVEKTSQARKPLLKFIKSSVLQLKAHPSIIAWQVENEPLDPSGPQKWHISPSLLSVEVRAVRKLDNRPIHINLWADDITLGDEYKAASRLADTVGIDLYYKQPAEEGLYHGPNFTTWQFRRWQWRNRLIRRHKPLWITELQAEPWEHNNEVKFSDNPGSINSSILKNNFEQAKKLKPQVVFFWGLEYWLWRQKQGNSDLIDTATDILKGHHPKP